MRSMKEKLLIGFAVFLVGITLLISSCQISAPEEEIVTPIPAVPAPDPEPEPTPEPVPTQKPTPVPTPEPSVELTPVPNPDKGKVNPLTGERVNSKGEPWDETKSRNRPWAVSIGNTPDAMPLWGIGEADIICEHIVETVATRILAIYQDVSDVGRIGGIRSLRSSNMEMAAGFDAIFAHWIGRTYHNEVTNGKGGTPVTDFGTIDASLIGERDPAKSGVNDAVVRSGERLISKLPETFRTELADGFEQSFKFREGKFKGGRPAGGVTVSFSARTSKRTEFTYNSSDGKYYVHQFGREMTDGNDNKILSFSNVLIVYTYTEFNYNPSGHTYIQTWGEGTGYYLADGRYTGITWSRESLDSPYCFFNNKGEPLEMGIGKTYICFISKDQVPVFK